MTSEEYKGLVLMQGVLIEMEFHDRTIKTIFAASEPMRYALTDKGRDAAERGRK